MWCLHGRYFYLKLGRVLMNVKKAAHRVLLVAYDGVNLLDLSGPLQVFEEASRELILKGSAGYELIVASPHGGVVKTGTGLAIMTSALPHYLARSVDTLVVPGGTTDGTTPHQPDIAAWIASHAGVVPRICAVCTGAFILAEAEVLENRKATTHWRWVDELNRKYPAVEVFGDSIYIKDEHVWTSAGVTAGVDLALALVAEDHGHRLAIDIARELVVYLKRSGGQSQYSAPLAHQRADNGMFSNLLVWMTTHLNDDLRVQRLAEIAGMSLRNFSRSFSETLGMTPAKAVERLRVEAASMALQDTDHSVKRIARDVGLGDEQNLRRLFKRHLGISPLQYRSRFSTRGPDENGRRIRASHIAPPPDLSAQG